MMRSLSFVSESCDEEWLSGLRSFGFSNEEIEVIYTAAKHINWLSQGEEIICPALILIILRPRGTTIHGSLLRGWRILLGLVRVALRELSWQMLFSRWPLAECLICLRNLLFGKASRAN